MEYNKISQLGSHGDRAHLCLTNDHVIEDLRARSFGNILE